METDIEEGLRVFSAHAEVVPFSAPTGKIFWRILRARGGSSNLVTSNRHHTGYSPRTRR